MAERVRKHKSDLTILFLIIVLMVIGLIVIYVVGPMRAKVLNSAYGMDYSSDYFFVHHTVNILLSLGVLFLGFKVVSFEKIGKIAKWLIIAALGASALLWILSEVGSSLAVCELGACRWFKIAGVSFQPAEFLKLSLVIYFANFIARKKKDGELGTKSFWIPFALISALSLYFVIVKQSDLGTGLAIIAIIIGMLFMSGISMSQFLAAIGLIGLVGVLVVVITPYRMERLMTFVGGGDDESSYHVENAMMAIGAGGFLGVGIGNSVQATGYLPESLNDSVFAVMGETFGFVGLLMILLIFSTILFRMLKISEHTEDVERRLYVIGVFSWIFMHVVANIMSMTGLIPVTGVTLPLLSYGGTSMLFISFGLGLVMQLSCYTSREVIKDESISSRRGFRGSYHTGRRSRP